MRILYLSPCAQLGGAERALLDCIASLRAAEPWWQLAVIAGEDGPLLAEARALGAHAHCLPFPNRFSKLGCSGLSTLQALFAFPGIAAYRQRLHQAIQTIAPDLIHTTGLKMHLLAAWDDSAPVVWHIHDYLGSRPVVARALRLSANRVCGILANSRSVAADIRALLGKTRETPVDTLLNAVDIHRFHPRGAHSDLDQLSSLPRAASGTVRVGLVGTFAKWKGHEVFLRALAQTPLKNLLLRAYIIGGPIYKTSHSQTSLAHLHALACEFGLQGRVGFTGFVPDIPAAMRSLDIVVHASTSPEPFGLVIAEAMACGRAVIASNAGGAAELISNESDGINIAPGDPINLAKQLHALTADPVKRMCLASAARTTAEARFDRQRLGPALAAFYARSRKVKIPESCASSTSTAGIGTAA
jgi:glycosyltransferase involved in cell wall biosynthesis